jgi:hypothetical protein
VAAPDEFAPGASLLIEAVESIDAAALLRVWAPYGDWKIGFRSDPEIDNTVVRVHLDGHPERLRRLMRLAVSGTITLEPPAKNSIKDDIERICRAGESGKWRDVLGVAADAAPEEVKSAFRKLALRFHPDKWETHPDPRIRDQVERAFCHLNRAQQELLAPKPSAPIPKAEQKPSLKEKASFMRWVYGVVRTK